MGFETARHHYQKPGMMLSGPSEARDAKYHGGLLIMVKGRSNPIRPTNVTLFVLLPLIYTACKSVSVQILVLRLTFNCSFK